MKIDISQEQVRFKHHIKLSGNDRIIFSGKFGTGKSFFLKKFAEESEEFESFFISPVNFTVAKNEDIFELIKFEIAFQLLGKKNLNFEKEEISKRLSAEFYLKGNFIDTLSLLAKGGGEIGKAVSEVYSNLKLIQKNIEAHNESSQIDEEKELKDFLHEFTKIKGAIYEENRITQLITVLLSQFKAQGKNSILIIDDLDRLDPDHIFRILNVFGSHLNFFAEDEIKFGFDKIILVCDIENIRQLFVVRYGQEMDFSGYIDKFYSREIFYFDNRETLKKSIENILSKIRINQNNDQVDLTNDTSFLTYAFRIIVTELVENDLINLRSLLKYHHAELTFSAFRLKRFPNGRITNSSLTFYMLFDFLFSFFGSKTSLAKSIMRLSDKMQYVERSERNEYYEDLLALASIEMHHFKEASYEDPVHINDAKIIVKFDLTQQAGYLFRTRIKNVFIAGNDSSKFPYGYYLNKALDSYFNIKEYQL